MLTSDRIPGRCPGLICGCPFGAADRHAGIDATVSLRGPAFSRRRPGPRRARRRISGSARRGRAALARPRRAAGSSRCLKAASRLVARVRGSSASRMRPTVSAAWRASATRPVLCRERRGRTRTASPGGARRRPSGTRRPPARAGGHIPGPIGRGAANIGSRGPIRGPASRRAGRGHGRARRHGQGGDQRLARGRWSGCSDTIASSSASRASRSGSSPRGWTAIRCKSATRASTSAGSP